MVCVFSAFVLGDDRSLKLFGLGLAVAVLIDATIVRMVLVPATMELLGDRNWCFPKWLDRILPRVHIEGKHAPVPPEAPEGDERSSSGSPLTAVPDDVDVPPPSGAAERFFAQDLAVELVTHRVAQLEHLRSPARTWPAP